MRSTGAAKTFSILRAGWPLVSHPGANSPVARRVAFLPSTIAITITQMHCTHLHRLWYRHVQQEPAGIPLGLQLLPVPRQAHVGGGMAVPRHRCGTTAVQYTSALRLRNPHLPYASGHQPPHFPLLVSHLCPPALLATSISRLQAMPATSRRRTATGETPEASTVLQARSTLTLAGIPSTPPPQPCCSSAREREKKNKKNSKKKKCWFRVRVKV